MCRRTPPRGGGHGMAELVRPWRSSWRRRAAPSFLPPPPPPPPSAALSSSHHLPPRARYSTPRTQARPRAPWGLGPSSPPPRPRSRSRRPRLGSEQIRAAGEDRWRAGPAPLLTCARRRRPEPAVAPRSSRRRGQEPVAVRCSRLAPPPRHRAPRAAAVQSHRGPELLAPPWPGAPRVASD